MQTSDLSSLYQLTGPFATVLIDVSHDTENGEQEHELRVRAACDQLREQGADDAVVDLLRASLGDLVHRAAPVARLVVANRDGIHHDEVIGMRVDQVVASWGDLPDLAPWIEHRDGAVTFVLAVVDHEGGDVAVHHSDLPDAVEETTVGKEDPHVNKVPVGGWSALRYQHYTENVWKQNAEAVVDELVSHVRAGHRLILLAGDPHSRGIVRSRLEGTQAELVELETGQRAADGGDEALQQAIREALMEHVVSRRLELVHEVKERLGRDHAVARGVAEVADAFVRGQVATLVLDRAAAAEVQLDPAQHPGLTVGADGPQPADRALVAAAALTGADVSVLPSATLGGAPVAALLRWDQQADGSQG